MPRHRAATRTRRPEERPHEILEAALRLFATRGYRATSIDDVANAAGVTKGAVYHYFGSKEDLLVAALEMRSRSIFDEADALASRQDGPVSVRLRIALRLPWQVFISKEWGGLFRLLIGDVAVEHAPLYQRWATEGPLRGWHLVQRLIEEGQRTGEFRRDVDAAVVGRQLVCGLVLQAYLGVHSVIADVEPIDPDRTYESTLDHFLRGLAASPPLASATDAADTGPAARPSRSARRRE